MSPKDGNSIAFTAYEILPSNRFRFTGEGAAFSALPPPCFQVASFQWFVQALSTQVTCFQSFVQKRGGGGTPASPISRASHIPLSLNRFRTLSLLQISTRAFSPDYILHKGGPLRLLKGVYHA